MLKKVFRYKRILLGLKNFFRSKKSKNQVIEVKKIIDMRHFSVIRGKKMRATKKRPTKKFEGK